jgi:TRAP-type C4-dicarboxylate transport system permease small subunit
MNESTPSPEATVAPSGPRGRITRVLDAYHRLLCVLVALLIGLMIVPVVWQILSRYDVLPSYVWTEEVARFCFVWMIMLGSMIAVRDRTHFDVDVLPHPRTPRGHAIARIVVHVTMLMMAVAFIWYGWDFARFGFIQRSEMSGINMLSIYASFPLAGITWTVFLLEHLVHDARMLSRAAAAPAA